MTITAKFASVCPCCNVRITPGAKVEWTKGTPARHVTCGTPAGAPTITMTRVSVADMPRRSSHGRGRWTGCSCGSREDARGNLISSERNCFTCDHDA
jgi:hypothetical protein